MVAVEWERIGTGKAEDVISMLLKNVYPDAERIWGAGGDEGRDVQIRTPDGNLHAFEIKGFTGRLTDSRRQQIKRSLKRAAQLNPLDWALLMPVDPTPNEERWLRALQRLVPFPTRWEGRLYLNTELAKRPWIERYLIGDWKDEVVRLLAQVGHEQAALERGVWDALERIEHVGSDLNELDPFYVWHVATDGRHTSISPSPRYRGAELDYPLEIHIQFEFTDDPEGRRAAEALKRHVDFGTPLEVPPQYVQRVKINAPVFPGGEFPPGGSISATSRPGSPSLNFLLSVVGPDGDVKASVPLGGAVTSAGERGSIIELRDASGTLTVRVTLDLVDGTLKLNFNYSLNGPFYPGQLRPVVGLFAEMGPPNLLDIRSSDGILHSSQVIEGIDTEAEDRRFLRLLDDLALIQWAAGQYEMVELALSKDDLTEIWLANELIRGRQLTSSWHDATFTVSDDASPEIRRLWTKDGFRLRVITQEPYVARIGGREYRLGHGVGWEVDSATMAAEHDPWREGGPPPGAHVRLVPKDSKVVRRWLVTEDAIGLGTVVQRE